jgi:hypothetical protein
MDFIPEWITTEVFNENPHEKVSIKDVPRDLILAALKPADVISCSKYENRIG